MSKDTDKAEDGFVDVKIGETLKTCLNSGFMVVTDQGRMVSINSEAIAMLQGTESSLLHEPVSALPAAVRKVIEESLTTGKNVSDRQFILPSVSPQERLFSMSTSLIPGVDAGHSLVLIRMTDLGAARKLEHNMRRLDRLASVGTLSASYAHELKNALVPVNTFLELTTAEHPDCDLSATAAQGIKRINVLVQQLNRLAAPSRPNFMPVHIHEVLEQSLTFVRHLIKDNSIEVHHALQAGNDRVEADAYQLEQAFLNMIFNAIDAMGPGGVLTLESRDGGEGGAKLNSSQLQICIRDTGVGIPPENMERLFETFFTTKQHGTGLGLAISRRILYEHGGDIRIESSLNEGTSVHITLPVWSEGSNRVRGVTH